MLSENTQRHVDVRAFRTHTKQIKQITQKLSPVVVIFVEELSKHTCPVDERGRDHPYESAKCVPASDPRLQPRRNLAKLR
jgi:hypothetical protein